MPIQWVCVRVVLRGKVMKAGFLNSDGKIIVIKMIETIHENKMYLSELDGAVGDGDHGINMDKGFSLAEKKIKDKDLNMSEALRVLGDTLLNEIGGSMGPLYGTMFRSMARASKHYEIITVEVLALMIQNANEAVYSLGKARVGDKTLIDTLEPASKALISAVESNLDILSSVEAMNTEAEAGWKSTKDMIARIGRAARLGERSRGSLDAGATSCFLLIRSIRDAVRELIS